MIACELITMAHSVTYFVLIILSICQLKSIFGAENETTSDWSVVPSFVSKLYGDCERKEFEIVDCLKVKVVSLLDRVGRSDVIKLDETISLVRESDRGDYGRALTENDVESTITGDENKSSTLNSMIFDRISRFLSSHSVKIGFPKIDAASFAKSLEEGKFFQGQVFCPSKPKLRKTDLNLFFRERREGCKSIKISVIVGFDGLLGNIIVQEL